MKPEWWIYIFQSKFFRSLLNQKIKILSKKSFSAENINPTIRNLLPNAFFVEFSLCIIYVLSSRVLTHRQIHGKQVFPVMIFVLNILLIFAEKSYL